MPHPGQLVQFSSKNRLTNPSVQSLMEVGPLPTPRESMAKSKKKPWQLSLVANTFTCTFLVENLNWKLITVP